MLESYFHTKTRTLFAFFHVDTCGDDAEATACNTASAVSQGAPAVNVLPATARSPKEKSGSTS